MTPATLHLIFRTHPHAKGHFKKADKVNRLTKFELLNIYIFVIYPTNISYHVLT